MHVNLKKFTSVMSQRPNEHLHHHLQVQSFAKMDQPQTSGEQQRQCESPTSKLKKKIGSEELASHRLIEKRRRDRMNSCLADLSRLIPSSYLKKGRGRVEKTEIVLMAIKYIRQLQQGGENSLQHNDRNVFDVATQTPPNPDIAFESCRGEDFYYAGYNECFEETIQYLIEKEGIDTGRIVPHLKSHYEELACTKGHKRMSKFLKTSKFPMSSDSDYGSLVSETSSSEWNSKTGPVLPKLQPINPGIPAYPAMEEVEDKLGRIRDQKRSHSVSEDPRGLYKFKADMRERFRFNNQDNIWPGSHLADPRQQEQDEKDESEWSWSSWNLKRRKFPVTFNTEFRDARVMPPPPSNSEVEDLSMNSNQKSETNWSKNRVAPFSFQQSENVDTSTSEPSPLIDEPVAGTTSSTNVFENLKKKTVPIFALHPVGSFYIPLVVNYGSLAPFMTVLDEPKNVDGHTLHPVTISVNFCKKPVIQLPPPSANLAEPHFSAFQAEEEYTNRSGSGYEHHRKRARDQHRCN